MDADHWNRIYASKAAEELSWTQPAPTLALQRVAELGLPLTAPMLEVGAGEAPFTRALLALGYTDLTVLDLSATALARAQALLGPAAGAVRWVEADVTAFAAPQPYHLWYDRATFHFLTDPEASSRYVAAAHAALAPGGYLLVGTFAADGPERCSGLPVRRYSAAELAAAFAPQFTCLGLAHEAHTTPWGAPQPFVFATLQRV